ncbi:MULTISPECIES: hypothetical protein [Streptomyces]|uniref:hypothetical protein n=1 Tax=Streptomyces malaysiensis TaxID=92644 RepID=UPI000BFE7A9C|nr:hypothetical protein [Streptomyces malaysiensis]ATL87023.1 hypothetical protein SMALA_6803 [Streptomyces malaysiensis]MCC4315570.1 hypothetical protein [Streptomyces malaysiensis]MCQ6247476.1 hypothetical protein [Streptomyces malaysiensis]QDL69493.1 hypothetical protein DNK48_08825 [Streptomyces malaysiensis]
MWPGQQPPGGEQNNPQGQNPYQQPGYQQPGYNQPNPYQQPGYQQPNPYQQPPQQQPPQQQPGQPQQPGYGPPQGPPGPPQGPPPGPPQGPPGQQWGAPSGPPGAPQPPRDNKKRTATIAIVAAIAVVAAAAITGALVLGKDDSDGGDESKGKDKTPAVTSSAPKSEEPTEDPAGGGADNPRAGGDAGDVKPVIPGWKPVVSAKRHNAFDVPPDWTVESPGLSTGFEDDKGKPLVVMSAPARFKKDYCSVKDKDGYTNKSHAAGAGSKGAQGAKSEASAAKIEAENWVFAAFDQHQTGTRKVTEAKKFTSAHGLKGYTSTATVTGVKKTDKCTTDGKSVTVTYTDTNGDFATWVLYSVKGTKEEVPESTIKKIMSSLRPMKSEVS